MKSIVTALTVVLLLCGVTYGQDGPGPSFEHLKGYGPMLGTWQYEGPLQEDLAGVAEKGTKMIFQFSWKRILNKNAVEENWSVEFEGGTTFSGKALKGWNADKKEIVSGGMNSLGGVSMGTVVIDKAAKTSTLISKGIDGDGKETSIKGRVTVTGEDTITWQALERTGRLAEGPSPIYTFKRVKKQAK
ncbi:hypothetical protein NZK35_05470 [Stieleria sp. ICT_E10.1]|uniref:hypothetical protein n=1 Tax=Stieleria sedimenti TaxID=2976331 RepID=UPI0021804BD1|nr:hypothetical protein [Stieleria sedimenti]MCS7466122.1 hypothetical protein [Stieleria sedimenti]